MIAIYHSRDLDGYTSGAIIKLKYPEATLIGYDYGEEFPWDRINEEEDVIMIDVSLPMEDMLKIGRRIQGQFTWIDHHISAINDYKKFLVDNETKLEGFDWITPVLENGISACEGGWKYLFPDVTMPEAIKLLGEYDTWRKEDQHRWDNAILPFQFGMRMICSSPETFPERLFFMDNPQDHLMLQGIINDGKVVLQYQAEVNAAQCRKAAFEFNFHGYRAICLNGGGFNSDVFKSVYDEKKHDIMMPFQFNGKFWVVSLYTTKEDIDCAAIAKQMGGGGHKKAAGFQVDWIESVFGLLVIPHSR